jgi:hypothetical protein
MTKENSKSQTQNSREAPNPNGHSSLNDCYWVLEDADATDADAHGIACAQREVIRWDDAGAGQ